MTIYQKFHLLYFVFLGITISVVQAFFCVEHLVRYGNIWHPGQAEELPHGRFFLSPNGDYLLDFFCNGSLELRESKGGFVHWQSNTHRKDVRKATLSYGNLVLTNQNGKEIWSTGSQPCPVYNYGEVKNDGRFVLYCGNQIIWSSKSGKGGIVNKKQLGDSEQEEL